MNFKNAFISPQSIQVCHLRSKILLTIVDRLRGQPRPIQRGRWPPRVPCRLSRAQSCYAARRCASVLPSANYLQRTPLPSLLSSLPTRRATLLCRSPLCLDLLSARGAARPASDQRRRERGVAREASRGRDGARMACAGVRRASPAGRRAGNGGEEAAQRRTVVVGRALTPGALHDKAKGWVRAQTGRGERGGAVGVRN